MNSSHSHIEGNGICGSNRSCDLISIDHGVTVILLYGSSQGSEWNTAWLFVEWTGITHPAMNYCNGEFQHCCWRIAKFQMGTMWP